MAFVDRQITCIDCAQPFVFTAGEQEFYERKGFREEPKRCKACRELRKQRRNDRPVNRAGHDGGGFGDLGPSGGNGGGNGNGNGNGFAGGNGHGHGADQGDDYDNIGNRASQGGGGRGGFAGRSGSGGGGPRSGGGGGRGQRELFEATCAQCGAQARVPFKPAAGRPVYCRDCYSNRAAAGGR
jgi:CxxC-x17-CxxC domain-containing protein